VIERLLPSAVASAETREELLEVELFPEEERALGEALAKRRREFVTGRACARQALIKLGVAPTPIASGERGEPLWPAGVVGSITHCRGYSACAVAHKADLRAVGIDAEPNRPLPTGVLARVAFGPERELLASDDGPHEDRLLFSAKEAVYKAWFPLTGRWLSFEQVQVSLERDAEEFAAALLVQSPSIDGMPLTELRGRWSVLDGVILTAVVVPRRVPE
jgi:4'-phosphopantetheinyl transferase EntD